jgi:hypothetical protein
MTIVVTGCSNPGTSDQGNMPPLLTANVTCNEISFYLDPTLGTNYGCVTVPESSGSDTPMDIFTYPVHTEFTIHGYPLTKTQFPPQIWVYPVERFKELLSDTIPSRVKDLHNFINDPAWESGRALPFLPPIPQMQTIVSHKSNLTFDGGKGIRFITEYSEGALPISNKNLIYTFQGLTDDGKYWVAITFPISHPILPAENGILPTGSTWESFNQNYTAYLDDVKESLEGQADSSFSPNLVVLDNIVRSISVSK